MLQESQWTRSVDHVNPIIHVAYRSQIFDVPGAKDFLLSSGFVETDDALATRVQVCSHECQPLYPYMTIYYQ